MLLGYSDLYQNNGIRFYNKYFFLYRKKFKNSFFFYLECVLENNSTEKTIYELNGNLSNDIENVLQMVHSQVLQRLIPLISMRLNCH